MISPAKGPGFRMSKEFEIQKDEEIILPSIIHNINAENVRRYIDSEVVQAEIKGLVPMFSVFYSKEEGSEIFAPFLAAQTLDQKTRLENKILNGNKKNSFEAGFFEMTSSGVITGFIDNHGVSFLKKYTHCPIKDVSKYNVLCFEGTMLGNGTYLGMWKASVNGSHLGAFALSIGDTMVKKND